jgi:hypothetical protein
LAGDKKAGIRRPLGHIVMSGERGALPCDATTSGRFCAADPAILFTGHRQWAEVDFARRPGQGCNITSFESASKPPELSGMSGSERASATARGPVNRSPGERKIRHPDPLPGTLTVTIMPGEEEA